MDKKQKKRKKAAVVKDAVQENQVLSCLQSASKPLNLAELAAQFKCDPGILESLLQEMEMQGQVIRTRKNRYGIPEKMNLFVGTIQGHPKGYAFFIPDVERDDFFISRENMGGAMHNDRVVVRPLGFSLQGKRAEGEVIRVLKRANSTVVGVFDETNRQFGFVIPDEKRLGTDIFVPRPVPRVPAAVIKWWWRLRPILGCVGTLKERSLSASERQGTPEWISFPLLKNTAFQRSFLAGCLKKPQGSL